MKTLYDVLGLSRSASAGQIEAAYRLALDELSAPGGQNADQIRAKAIGEAYGVLSSPSRRDAYDARLQARETAPVTIVVEEERKRPWLLIAGAVIVIAASFTWYKVQAARAETARVAFEAARAAAAAAEAARLADLEESRLAQQVLAERTRADAQRAREVDQLRAESRAESRYNAYNANRYDPDAGMSPERRREQAAARIKSEQLHDEMLAQQRARQQVYDMQRALAIPIVRH